MDINFDVRILRLTIQKNEVEYTYSKATSELGELADSHPDKGKQVLSRDTLSDRTITALIGQLTLLSDLIRDRRVKIDENELLAKLSDVVKVLGEHLYNVLFKGKVIDGDPGGLEKYLNDALSQVKLLALLRVELECKDQELAVWPWEYLFKPDGGTGRTGFLVNLAKQLVLNRILYQPGYSSKLETPRPVKVLLVGVQPKKFGRVQYERVRDYLRGLQSLGWVELEEIIDIYPYGNPEKNPSANYYPTATREYFQERIGVKEKVGVKPFDPHIIHFIGHGSSFEKVSRIGKMGRIGLVKEAGEVDWVDDSTFAGWLANGASLKLVFLQACESALPDPYRSASGMAMQLAQKDIPAVVAMQYKIDNQTANKFALDFYKALLAGQTVDRAVKAGRAAIDNGDEEQIYAFGLPVLYLRSYERVFLPENKKPATGVPGAINREDEKCDNCKKYLYSGRVFKFCPDCRRSLQDRPLNCPFCGERGGAGVLEVYDPYRNACGNCGKKLICGRCNQRFTEQILVSKSDDKLCKICSGQEQQQSSSMDNYAGPSSDPYPITSS